MRFVMVLGAIAAPVLLSTMPAVAQGDSTGLEDLIGARAGQAEGEIVRRGFRNTGGSKGDDRSYVNWWNASTRRCVVVGTSNGRYVSVQATTAPDCKQPANVRPRPDYGYQPQPDRPRPEYGDGGYDRPSNRPDGSDNVSLICSGDGSADGRGRFGASLNVEIFSGGGRIRLPKELVPPLNSGGRDGWWQLDNVVARGRTIRASYRLNSVNRPQIVIDRRSGEISIQGYSQYAFNGDCSTANDGPRRF